MKWRVVRFVWALIYCVLVAGGCSWIVRDVLDVPDPAGAVAWALGPGVGCALAREEFFYVDDRKDAAVRR